MIAFRFAHPFATIAVAFVGFLFFGGVVAAPIDFVEQPALAGPGVSSAQSYAIADLDNDGDNDVVSVSATAGSVVFFENLGGSFAPPRVVGETPFPRALAIADLDNDGLPDILVTETSLDQVLALFNEGASGFSQPVIVAGFGDQQPDVDTADFDNDGDLDVVYINFADDTAAYVENLGGRTFGPPVNFPTSVDGPQAMDVGDINNDGEPDVLVTSGFDNTVGWFPSNGDGTFGARQVVSTATTNPRGAELGDLNGDGLLDVVSFPGNGAAITYYLNTGAGSFGTEQRFSFVSPDRVAGVKIADFDGDGDNDVAYLNQITNGDDDISFLVNNGSGVLSNPTPIATNINFGFTFEVGDVLGGTAPDVVFLNDISQIDIAENQTGGFAPPVRITPAIATAVAIDEADAEGDADTDLFVVGFDDGSLYFLENLGGTFAPLVAVNRDLGGPGDVVAVDLDGDGDIDPAVAESISDSVSVFEQTAPGVFGARQQVTNLSDGARRITAGDIDADGDLDIVAASNSDDEVAWYENLGSLTFGGQQLITLAADGPSDVVVYDIDGDGLNDVLVIATQDDELDVFRNLGSGSFTTSSPVANGLDNPQTIGIADIDNDGQVDVVVASLPNVRWFRNTSTAGQINLAEQPVLTQSITGNPGFIDMRLIDLDDDGDIDIVLASASRQAAYWFENDGAGQFSDIEQLASSRTRLVGAFDADSDGFVDLVLSDTTNAALSWYRNGLIRDFGDAPDPSYPTLRASDGARHEISTLFMGLTIDDEVDGQPTSGVDGDDTDAATNDDDGVVFNGLVQEGLATLDVTVSQAASGFVSAFIDANDDGDFDDPGERVVASEFIDNANELINFAMPSGATNGDRVARVRLASVAEETESPTGQANDGEVEDYIVTISQATLDITDASIGEGDTGTTLLSFPVTLTDPLSNPLSFTLVATPVTADASDFVPPSAPFTIPAGSTAALAQISIVGDSNFELDETFDVTLSTGSSVLIGQSTATGTIGNDDVQPEVSLTVDTTSIAENAGVAVLTATLSAESYQTITVPIVFSGDATAGTDYNTSANQIVISPGQTSGTLSVTAIDDAAVEADEQIDAALGAITNGAPATASAVSITIVDDELPVATLSVDQTSIDESGGVATLTATLSFAPSLPVSLDLGFAGSASAQDYSASAGVLNFAPNQTTASLTITGTNDPTFETTETVIVSLIAANNASIGAPSDAAINVLDDDVMPSVSIAASTDRIDENGGTATVTVSLSNPSVMPVTVDLLASGTASNADYSIGATQIVIAPETLAASTVVTGVDDSLVENTETLSLTIDSVSNATLGSPSIVDLVIDDDEAPIATLSVSPNNIDEAGGSATITADLSFAALQNAELTLATAGSADTSDFELSASVIQIAAGDLSGSVTVTGLDDSIFEGDETIELSIAMAVNATASSNTPVTVTIFDDELPPPPGLTLTASQLVLAESGGSSVITASIATAFPRDVIVPLLVRGGVDSSDYQLPSQIIIPARQTSASVMLTVVDDAIDEADELIVIFPGGVANTVVAAPNTVSIRIIDDEATPVGAPIVDRSEPLMPQTVVAGYQRVPVATFGLRNSQTEDATVRRVTVAIEFGSLGFDSVTTVLLYEDLNGDGVVQPGEPLVAITAPEDLSASLDFAMETPITLPAGTTRRFIALANQ
ncbi:MAG: FG-GAP-like repeat-containing protein [Pseudomonadota bacterium]